MNVVMSASTAAVIAGDSIKRVRSKVDPGRRNVT